MSPGPWFHKLPADQLPADQLLQYGAKLTAAPSVTSPSLGKLVKTHSSHSSHSSSHFAANTGKHCKVTGFCSELSVLTQSFFVLLESQNFTACRLSSCGLFLLLFLFLLLLLMVVVVYLHNEVIVHWILCDLQPVDCFNVSTLNDDG